MWITPIHVHAGLKSLVYLERFSFAYYKIIELYFPWKGGKGLYIDAALTNLNNFLIKSRIYFILLNCSTRKQIAYKQSSNELQIKSDKMLQSKFTWPKTFHSLSFYWFIFISNLTCDIATQSIWWLRPVAVLMEAISSPLMLHTWRYVPAHVAMSPWNVGRRQYMQVHTQCLTKINLLKVAHHQIHTLIKLYSMFLFPQSFTNESLQCILTND